MSRGKKLAREKEWESEREREKRAGTGDGRTPRTDLGATPNSSE
jgi:hypothetical protein